MNAVYRGVPLRQIADIRVFCINAARIPSDPLDLSMGCYSFDGSLDYCALSYCWGRRLPTRTIKVNGLDVEITENLDSALRELRKFGHLQYVWVDALCINQHAPIERAYQVQHMGRIYENATSVLAWLGPGNFAKEIGTSFDCFRNFSVQSFQSLSRTKPNASKKADLGTKLLVLFRNPYWRRVWIIQELAIAKKVLFFSSDDTMSWDEFDKWLKWSTEQSIDDETVWARLYKLESGFSCVVRITMARAKFQDGQRLPPLKVLFDTHTSLATDERDKVYGVLSLVRQSREYVDIPNYDIGVKRLQKNLAIAIMHQTGCFDLICWRHPDRMLEDGRQNPSFSWLPGLLQVSTWHELRDWQEYCVTEALQADTCLWRAAPKLPPSHKWKRFSGDCLILKGFVLGELQFLTCQWDGDGRVWRDQPRKYTTGRESQNKPTSIAATVAQALTGPASYAYPETRQLQQSRPSSRAEQVFNSIVPTQDTIRVLKYALSDKQRIDAMLKALGTPEMTAWLDKFRHIHIQNRSIDEIFGLRKTGKSLITDKFRFRARSQISREDCNRIFKRIQHVVLGRRMRLFETDTGIIGMAHNQTQPGDKVVLMAGCTIPVILRPVASSGSERYQVVGDAWVGSMMLGQGWGPRKGESEAMFEQRLRDFELV